MRVGFVWFAGLVLAGCVDFSTDGLSCAADGDCLGLYCNGGTCSDTVAGRACTADGDCPGLYCNNGVCSDTVVGRSCTSDSECPGHICKLSACGDGARLVLESVTYQQDTSEPTATHFSIKLKNVGNEAASGPTESGVRATLTSTASFVYGDRYATFGTIAVGGAACGVSDFAPSGHEGSCDIGYSPRVWTASFPAGTSMTVTIPGQNPITFTR